MKKITIIFLALAFQACGGSSLLTSNQDTGATGTLTVTVAHHLANGSTLATTGGVKTFTNDQGFQISLTEAEVGWRRLILISDGTGEAFPECVAGRDVTLELGGADDLLGADLTNLSLVTNQSIQQVSYCRYQIVLGPASTPAALSLTGKNHTTGATTSGSAQPATVTYHFQGTWQKGAQHGTIDLESVEPITLTGNFKVDDSGVEVDHPLHFHAGETHEDLGFEIHYDSLFRDIDFSLDSVDSQKSSLYSNFAGSIHQTIVSD